MRVPENVYLAVSLSRLTIEENSVWVQWKNDSGMQAADFGVAVFPPKNAERFFSLVNAVGRKGIILFGAQTAQVFFNEKNSKKSDWIGNWMAHSMLPGIPIYCIPHPSEYLALKGKYKEQDRLHAKVVSYLRMFRNLCVISDKATLTAAVTDFGDSQ